MKLQINLTLLCLIVGGRISILGVNLIIIYLNIIREWPKNTPSILRNLDNFPPGASYLTPQQLLRHKTVICFRLYF